MDDKKAEDRRDDLLRRLLKTPPQPRADRKRPRGKPDSEPSQSRVSETGDGKRAPFV